MAEAADDASAKKKKQIPKDLVIPDKKPKLTKQQRRDLQNRQRYEKKALKNKKLGGTPPSMHQTAAAREEKNGSADKIIYIIRHAESQGQVARHIGLDRKRDSSLIDAGLTKKGQTQAEQIPQILGSEVMSSIQLVVSSPLTRALHTALIGFADRSNESKFLLNYNIRELGSSIPENIPRPIDAVLRDLSHLPRINEIDHDSYKPEKWPEKTNSKSDTNSKERIAEFLLWLAREREERVIAIVCHHNVIQAALRPSSIKPVNALPIPCRLNFNGEIRPVKNY